jgi:FtsP/CotA-like multicopper oxidase with cupredoxin domain
MSAVPTLVDRRKLLKAGAIVAGAGLFGTPVAWADLKAKGAAAHWPVEFQPGATDPTYPPRDLPKEGDPIHVFDMEITIGTHEIVPGVSSHMFLFNGTFPGPEIRVKEGDWVQVNLTNHSPESHTIHWHGIQVPCEMDGVPLGTQWPVMPNQTFRYLWRAQPAGTHFYHCHVMTTLHSQAGLVGSLIVEPSEDPIHNVFPYDREYTLLLSEIDTNWVRDQLNAMVTMGTTMEKMSHNARLMHEMNGRMMGWFKNKSAFLQAMKEGYIPPYVNSMTGLVKPMSPNYFMINGKAYPMTDAVSIKRGETIRVRLIGAGSMPHYMHLHGHDFWHVAQDGSPLASPVRLNTIPVNPGSTSDIVIQGTNPGHWHFHDHNDFCSTNNGQYPGGMMTMLMYEDAKEAGFTFEDVISLSS